MNGIYDYTQLTIVSIVLVWLPLTEVRLFSTWIAILLLSGNYCALQCTNCNIWNSRSVLPKRRPTILCGPRTSYQCTLYVSNNQRSPWCSCLVLFIHIFSGVYPVKNICMADCKLSMSSVHTRTSMCLKSITKEYHHWAWGWPPTLSDILNLAI